VPAWAWIVIAVAVVAVLALVAWTGTARRRTGRLQRRFGPEYNRMISGTQSKREAESELQTREERRRELDIRPLSPEARARYVENWQAVQAQFVDDPRAAVATADTLIQSAMAERGYPVEDFDQRTNDLSVDHPRVVENYREGHRLAQASAEGRETTEDLRQAMRHYRALFAELVEADADRPISRDTAVESETEAEARERA
jgi:FtsZ-interacting cell division protein ZipA